jgi:hypothetical protein
MTPRRVYAVIGLLIFSVILIILGHVDLDWMVVAPRFNSWYYTVDFWEFAPYLQMNWHVAYMYTVVRLSAGWFMLGAVLTFVALKLNGDSS